MLQPASAPAGRIVKASQQTIDPAHRNTKARFDMLGKEAVTGRSKRPFALDGDAPRLPAERPFGSDMQTIRRKAVDLSLQPPGST